MKTSDKKVSDILSNETEWQKFYVLTEHWQSDLEFYKDDLRFLHHLVDKYFIWITKSENLEMVREILLQVNDLQKRCESLIKKVLDHRHDLTYFENKTDASRWQQTLEQHEEMEKEIYTFVKEFRANRKEVFRITEYVIDSEQLSDLIRS